MSENLLMELSGVSKSFRSADGAPRLILDDVNFSLAKGEIVALLGKSGSGKSTLLRIMAGLIPSDAGNASYRGKGIRGPAPGVAMVFQSFALFPWLTVQQNVELGLEAQGMAPAEREKRADAMLELMAWPVSAARCRASCRAACASASASPAPSSPIPTCC